MKPLEVIGQRLTEENTHVQLVPVARFREVRLEGATSRKFRDLNIVHCISRDLQLVPSSDEGGQFLYKASGHANKKSKKTIQKKLD